MPRAAPVRVPPRGVDPDARADAHWHVRAFFLHVSSEAPPAPPHPSFPPPPAARAHRSCVPRVCDLTYSIL